MVGFDVIFDLMLSIDGSGGAVSAPSWVVYFALLRDADSLAVSAHLPVSVASNNLCCTRRSRKGSGVRRGGGKSIKEISAADPAAASERRQTGLPPFYLIDTTLLWLITTLRDKKRKSFGSFVFFIPSYVCFEVVICEIKHQRHRRHGESILPSSSLWLLLYLFVCGKRINFSLSGRLDSLRCRFVWNSRRP